MVGRDEEGGAGLATGEAGDDVADAAAAGAADAAGEGRLDLRLEAEGGELGVEAALDGGAAWGRFDVRIDGRSRWLPLVAAAMNLRSRLTGIATGDQGIFVTREAFAQAGGFAPIPLMEDIALSRTLKRVAGRPACLRERIVTSGRRWETRGPWRTIFTMWRLRAAYALGADPVQLARLYR